MYSVFFNSTSSLILKLRLRRWPGLCDYARDGILIFGGISYPLRYLQCITSFTFAKSATGSASPPLFGIFRSVGFSNLETSYADPLISTSRIHTTMYKIANTQRETKTQSEQTLLPLSLSLKTHLVCSEEQVELPRLGVHRQTTHEQGAHLKR